MRYHKEIEERIKQSVENAAPDVLDNILSGCGQQKGIVIGMREGKKRNNLTTAFAAAAAAVVITAGGFIGYGQYQTYHTVDSVIGFDVNPSIELKTNASERVLEAEALNEDAKIIMADMDLKGTDLNVAVNALIGSMLKNGYISDITNSILVSVENGDQEKGEELQSKIVTEINDILKSESVDGAILSQTVSEDEETGRLAQEYGISVGKAALIREIMSEDKRLSAGELAALNINELNLLASGRNSMPENIESVGSASDKAYIGEQAAKDAAIAHAGIAAADAKVIKVGMDLEDGVMVYEIKFRSGNDEYEYEVSAEAGEILKFDHEYEEPDDDLKAEQNSAGTAGAGQQNPAGGQDQSVQTGQTEQNLPQTGGTADQNQTQQGTQGQGTTQQNGDIGAKAAKDAALAHAGVAEGETFKLEIDKDAENNLYVYEVEFHANGIEYHYDINASTGEIVKYETEQDDDDDDVEVFRPQDPVKQDGTQDGGQQDGGGVHSDWHDDDDHDDREDGHNEHDDDDHDDHDGEDDD